MKISSARFLAFCCLLFAPLSVIHAGTVHGTVKNGTTGKLVPGIEVILIQLQGGMQPVLNSKTDAQGQFSFDYASIGAQPMLIRAVYRGVNFHQPLPPGRGEVEVQVFDSSRDPKTIHVTNHIVIFQPSGSTLTVGEEYAIKNDSQPPQAFFRADGTFDFALPDKADLKQVAAQGPAGMPVVQAPIDRGKNRYSVAYAFRPGDNGLRYTYELPYPGNSANVKIPTVYPGVHLIIVAPPTMLIGGDGLQPGGQEQGLNVYARENIPANAPVAISVSGTAPQDATSGGADSGPQGRDAQQGSESSAGATIVQVPGRLDALKWPIIGGFVVLFAMGAILLARRPVVAVAGDGPVEGVEGISKASKMPAASQRKTSGPPPTKLADIDAAVGTSLDALKEAIFRLELRHQAGIISEDEYKQERARAEKVLRDLVRG
jgi:hypothetical protein